MSQKYKGPASQAPPEIRERIEKAWGGPLPDDAWLNVDFENRPEWAEITVKVSKARERLNAPFPPYAREATA